MKILKSFQVLIIIPFAVLSSCGQRWNVFTCYNQEKCQGLNFSIKYPSNWSSIEGDRPHIVQKFEYTENQRFIQLLIYLDRFDQVPTSNEIENIYALDNLIADQEVLKTINYKNDIIIDGIKSAYGTFQIKGQVYDQEIRTLLHTNILVWRDYLLQFNFFIISNDQSFESMEDMFYKNQSLFREIMSSIIIISQWEQE